MKIAVVGSRNFKRLDLVDAVVKEFSTKEDTKYLSLEEDILVSGGASGVDKQAEKMADKRGIKKIIKDPNNVRDKSGNLITDNRRFHIRNQEIIDEADIVIVFWDKKSTGTLSTLNSLVRSLANKPKTESGWGIGMGLS